MSRHIQTIYTKNRTWNHTTNGSKLIFTDINNMLFGFYLQEDQLINVQKISLSAVSQIGEIYVGKVKNIVHNIDSCFIEIANGQVCYLPLKDVRGVERFVQGFELPVQVKRDAIKTKPAAVTTAIEHSCEYFVFKKDMHGIGISEKINREKSAHIKSLLKTVSFENEFISEYGVIARTKCQELDDASLLEIFNEQHTKFIEIFKKAKFATCYSCIKKGDSPVITFIQENSSWKCDEIITDIPEIYEILSSNGYQNASKPVVLYKDESISLKTLYGLQSKFEEACNKKVWLKSGSNLVIEQTECLTAIDVNSSKNISKKMAEEAVLNINIEAAAEAARQIRLRNLSGIIIVDFINMQSDTDNKALLKFLSELVSEDPITTKVIDMTPLGLVDITRKKVHMSLNEQVKESF